jgi:hypothetical protein
MAETWGRKILNAQHDDWLKNKYFPDGKAAFDEMWRSEPQRAFMRMIDGVNAKNEADWYDQVDEMITLLFPRLDSEKQLSAVCHMANVYFTLDRAVKRAGLDADRLIEKDMKATELENAERRRKHLEDNDKE